MGILPARRFGSEEGAESFSIGLRRVLPISADGVPALAQPLLVGDWIDDGDGLLNWLEQAQPVPADALKRIRAEALPGEFDKVADQARSLRAMVQRLCARTQGASADGEEVSAELEPLNRSLERDDSFKRVVPGPKGEEPLQLQTIRRWRTPEALLSPIGEALAQLVCAGKSSRT